MKKNFIAFILFFVPSLISFFPSVYAFDYTPRYFSYVDKCDLSQKYTYDIYPSLYSFNKSFEKLLFVPISSTQYAPICGSLYDGSVLCLYYDLYRKELIDFYYLPNEDELIIYNLSSVSSLGDQCLIFYKDLDLPSLVCSYFLTDADFFDKYYVSEIYYSDFSYLSQYIMFNSSYFLINISPFLLKKIVALQSSYRHSCALLSNESVICWGWNNEGQLGDGTYISSLVPKFVTLNPYESSLLKDVKDIYVGSSYSCALLNNLSMVCWGENFGTFPRYVTSSEDLPFYTRPSYNFLLKDYVKYWDGSLYKCFYSFTYNLTLCVFNNESMTFLEPSVFINILEPKQYFAYNFGEGYTHYVTSSLEIHNISLDSFYRDVLFLFDDYSIKYLPNWVDDYDKYIYKIFDFKDNSGCIQFYNKSLICWNNEDHFFLDFLDTFYTSVNILSFNDERIVILLYDGDTIYVVSSTYSVPNSILSDVMDFKNGFALLSNGSIVKVALSYTGKGGLSSSLIDLSYLSEKVNYNVQDYRRYVIAKNLDYVWLYDSIIYSLGAVFAPPPLNYHLISLPLKTPYSCFYDSFSCTSLVNLQLYEEYPYKYLSNTIFYLWESNDLIKKKNVDDIFKFSSSNYNSYMRYRGCFLTSNGSVMCNDAMFDGFKFVKGGQQGTDILRNVIKVSSSSHHTCALLNNGSVMCWGSNVYGQLGDGTYTNRNYPVFVKGGQQGTDILRNVRDIVVDLRYSCAVLLNGSVMCWGDITPLGVSFISSTNMPVYVVPHKRYQFITSEGPSNAIDVSYFFILPTSPLYQDDFHNVCFVSKNGSLYCHIKDPQFSIDIGMEDSASYGDINYFYLPPMYNVSQVVYSPSNYDTGKGASLCILYNNGTVMCLGDNYYGGLGRSYERDLFSTSFNYVYRYAHNDSSITNVKYLLYSEGTYVSKYFAVTTKGELLTWSDGVYSPVYLMVYLDDIFKESYFSSLNYLFYYKPVFHPLQRVMSHFSELDKDENLKIDKYLTEEDLQSITSNNYCSDRSISVGGLSVKENLYVNDFVSEGLSFFENTSYFFSDSKFDSVTFMKGTSLLSSSFLFRGDVIYFDKLGVVANISYPIEPSDLSSFLYLKDKVFNSTRNIYFSPDMDVLYVYYTLDSNYEDTLHFCNSYSNETHICFSCDAVNGRYIVFIDGLLIPYYRSTGSFVGDYDLFVENISYIMSSIVSTENYASYLSYGSYVKPYSIAVIVVVKDKSLDICDTTKGNVNSMYPVRFIAIPI